MATQPWVTPEEVIAYTDYDVVKTRSVAKLRTDIARAEAYIISFTHNDFHDVPGEQPVTVPDAVKTADILLAEAYAYNNTEQVKRMKTESFDDYSYTVENALIDIDSLDLGTLLSPYIIPESTGKVTFRLRKL